MDQHHQAGTLTSCRPLQHFKIAIRISKRRDGASPDKFVNGHGLFSFIIDEVDFSTAQIHKTQWVDNDLNALSVKLHVIICRTIFKLKTVLKTRAPAALNKNPKAQFRIGL